MSKEQKERLINWLITAPWWNDIKHDIHSLLNEEITPEDGDVAKCGLPENYNVAVIE